MDRGNYKKYLWDYLNENPTLEEYVAKLRGPRQLKLEYLIPLVIVYAIIFVVGFLGNVLLSVAILCNRSLYSPTNFYIITLSFTDLTLLILGLPIDFYVLFNFYPWRFGDFGCIAKSLLSDITAYSSVLIVVALTIERYLAICHPFGPTFLKDSCIFSKFTCIDLRSNHYHDHPIVVICLSVIFGIFLGYFLSEDYQIHKIDYINKTIDDSAICTVNNEDSGRTQLITFLSFFITFVIPVAVLTILYLKIIIKIKKSLREVNRFKETHNNNQYSHTNATNNNCSEMKISTKSRRKNMEKAISLQSSAELPCSMPLQSPDGNQTFQMVNGNEINPQSNHDIGSTSNSHNNRKKMHTLNLRRTIRVPIWVVISFFGCFAPFHICRLLNLYHIGPFGEEKDNYLLMYHISGLCLYSISVANPILYNLLSKRFQRVFFSIFKRKSSKSLTKSFQQRTLTLRMYSSNSPQEPGCSPSRSCTLRKSKKFQRTPG